jgi:hypothetical protein
MIDVYTTFKLMYSSLDSLWDKTHDDELGQYLSNMNPFLWKDEGSADPIIYSNFKSEFSKKFNSKCSFEDGYNFVKQYLEKGNDTYTDKAKKSFSNVSLKDWIKSCNDLKAL